MKKNRVSLANTLIILGVIVLLIVGCTSFGIFDSSQQRKNNKHVLQYIKDKYGVKVDIVNKSPEKYATMDIPFIIKTHKTVSAYYTLKYKGEEFVASIGWDENDNSICADNWQNDQAKNGVENGLKNLFGIENAKITWKKNDQTFGEHSTQYLQSEAYVDGNYNDYFNNQEIIMLIETYGIETINKSLEAEILKMFSELRHLDVLVINYNTKEDMRVSEELLENMKYFFNDSSKIYDYAEYINSYTRFLIKEDKITTTQEVFKDKTYTQDGMKFILAGFNADISIENIGEDKEVLVEDRYKEEGKYR